MKLTDKQLLALRAKVRMNVAKWAEEKAQDDLAFAGESAWLGIPADKREIISKALIQYAITGAVTTFDALQVHGHLNIAHD